MSAGSSSTSSLATEGWGWSLDWVCGWVKDDLPARFRAIADVIPNFSYFGNLIEYFNL